MQQRLHPVSVRFLNNTFYNHRPSTARPRRGAAGARVTGTFSGFTEHNY